MEPRVLCIVAAADVPRTAVAESSLEAEAVTPGRALERLLARDYDAVVLQLPLSAAGVADLLPQVRDRHPSLPLLARDPGASLSDAARLGRLGVWGFLGAGAEARREIEAG